ncbi:zona pellucida sperm-binding protein 4 [Molossus molossus]|uniref:Zona pellucida sperm-binding protein 4 n=1 Tax=Molossus molossus TaxID=27622 RepID=A0A7J8BN52_MOLMO|nr:zona pellucida sperm-binding protein 4 [Molossus molossus]KAF6400148.1 zona pellucida glycoprotein 4 [Molossus molossus]
MWLWSLLLSFPLSLAVSGLHEPEAPERDGELHCGPQGLRFTVQPPDLGTGDPPALIVWDDHGQLYQLQNDSGCGTQVMAGPGSSMVLEASYGSCYVTELGTQHVMPVGVEGADAAGHKTVEETRLLKCPLGLPAPNAVGADLCDSVPERDRLPCLPSPAAQEDCKRLGCCYNPSGKSCHYGNTVTTHCTQDGHFAIAVARDVTAPPLLVRSVHLASQNSSECDPVTATQAFALFRFPFTACGTTRRVTGDQAVYEVELSAARDVSTWSRGSVTRDSIFRLRVRCTYAVSSNALPVTVQVFLLPPPLPETQPGPLTLELRVAKDKNYSSYYSVDDYPVVKLLRDPIYVEVSIRHRTDPNLGMLLQCWATPGPDPRHRLQWALLVRGCPYTGDNYQTQLIPVQEDAGLPFPSHYQRFSISTFSFVDSGARRALGGPVYLHCSVSICQPEGTLSCVTCPVARRRRSSGSFHNSTASISGQGPLILLQATTDASENLRKFSGPPVDARALWVASLSGTFIVGILLVSYLAIKKRR